MDDPIEREKISEAVEKYLRPSYLSREARERINERYGAEIAARVKQIYDEVLKCDIDWRTATMDEALAVARALLDAKYAWLSKAARGDIINAFIMEWR
jgi:hypothetical protein